MDVPGVQPDPLQASQFTSLGRSISSFFPLKDSSNVNVVSYMRSEPLALPDPPKSNPPNRNPPPLPKIDSKIESKPPPPKISSKLAREP